MKILNDGLLLFSLMLCTPDASYGKITSEIMPTNCFFQRDPLMLIETSLDR
jgi:hypothetical protein